MNMTDKTQPLFDTPGTALKCYDSVRVNDPRGPWLIGLPWRRGTWRSIGTVTKTRITITTSCRMDYPKSKYQLQSHLLGVQCKVLKYQGPGYNSKPLEEAKSV